MSGNRYSTGFTLIEVLVGLTLLGLILTMVFSALYTTSQSWQAGDNQANTNDAHRLGLDFIHREIRQAVPVFYLEKDDNRLLFNGERESLQFVSRLPAHRGGSDLYLAALELDKENQALRFSYRLLQIDPGSFTLDDEHSKHKNILRPISAIELTYYGRESPNEEPSWHDTWEEREQMPQLVRLKILSAGADKWPELYISVPSSMERGLPEMLLTMEEK